MTPAPETSVRDAANINEIFLSDSLNGELEFEPQEDLVLDDRELRELLPEREQRPSPLPWQLSDKIAAKPF